MRKTCFALLPILFVALSANTLPEPVLDIEGNPLKIGGEYTIVVSGFGGGGIGVVNSTCDVVQRPLYLLGEDYGYPLAVTFISINPEEEEVHLSTNLKIKFAYPPTNCLNKAWWTLVIPDDVYAPFFVEGRDEIPGGPECDTLSNWFKIEKTTDKGGKQVYKIVFCPNLCPYVILCKDIGTIYPDGFNRLGLTLTDELALVDPLTVEFGNLKGKSSV